MIGRATDGNFWGSGLQPLSRRVASGDVLHGMFGAWVVRSYATQMYGPDWDKRQPDDEEGAQDE